MCRTSVYVPIMWIKEFLHAKIIEHTKTTKKMHVVCEYVYRLLGIHTGSTCTAGWLIKYPTCTLVNIQPVNNP